MGVFSISRKEQFSFVFVFEQLRYYLGFDSRWSEMLRWKVPFEVSINWKIIPMCAAFQNCHRWSFSSSVWRMWGRWTHWSRKIPGILPVTYAWMFALSLWLLDTWTHNPYGCVVTHMQTCSRELLSFYCLLPKPWIFVLPQNNNKHVVVWVVL